MAPNFEIVVGTYEQFLVGYTVDDVVNKYKMEQSFAMHSHLASIRSVASKKHYLASAAADDTVCLYDMRNRTESGKLVHHNDTVNSICFTPDASHIMTASSDGTIGIVRCGNWQLEKHWLKPHKGMSVDTLAIHPTGKLAMTTGHDGVLRTWNLVKGRQAYATNLVPRWKLDAKNISALKWSPDGNNYLIAANNRVDIYSLESAGIEEECSFNSKVVCVEYLNDNYIAIGLADGKICIYDIENSTLSNEIQAHDARVKCLSRDGDLLVSASSSGAIKLWSIEKDKLILLNEVNCSARISCLTLSSCQGLIYKKEEIDLEEKVSVKPTNKLRLRQQVIIEQDEPEQKTRISKKKRGKKKVQEIMENENENVDTEIPIKTKKVKTDNAEKTSPKRKKTNDIPELEEDIPKKKKKLLDSKKRKQTELSVDETQPIAKKKKQKEITADNDNAIENSNIHLKKKKRKLPVEDEAENVRNKQKVLVNIETKSLLKKKTKKHIKNKIPR